MSDSSSHQFLSESNRFASLAAGTILQDRYRVVRRLGKGGMGAVYQAIDSRLETTVAIKEAFSTDHRLRKQFEHEARLLAQLHHPALPRVTDYFAEGARVFLVMQFITGDDLAEIILKQPGPLPRNTVIAWADQLLDALIYLHTRERQIIHRDIKPHNLKLTTAGTIALLDFGLAKADSDTTTLSSSSSVFGFTRRYSPPEQMQDQGTTPQSDIYALGATLYHLLTAVKPPDALVRAAAFANSEGDPLLPANEIHAAVGPEVSAILLKAMQLNPERRFKDAAEFREALRKLGRNPDRSGHALDYWNQAGTSDAAGRPSVNVTVINKPVDPFDSYSILKPVENDWLIPKPSRRPFIALALIGLLLVGGVFAFSDTQSWANFSKTAVDYVQTKADAPDSTDINPGRKLESARGNNASVGKLNRDVANVRSEKPRKLQSAQRGVRRNANER